MNHHFDQRSDVVKFVVLMHCLLAFWRIDLKAMKLGDQRTDGEVVAVVHTGRRTAMCTRTVSEEVQ